MIKSNEVLHFIVQFTPLNNIAKVCEENLKQLGYRRIKKYLKEDYGIIYNAKKVLQIMKENNIQAEYVWLMRRKILIKQNRNKNIIKYSDLVNRNFNDIKERFSILFTYVTYLILNGKKHYQLTILDGYNKEIIDVKWLKFNNKKLIINNLNDAITKIKKIKKDLNKTIIHSDHGYQYTSKDYNSKCLDNKIIISMGKKYHCADNIVIKSFHSLIKKGTIHNKNYKSHNEYINDVKKLNKWYSNRK